MKFEEILPLIPNCFYRVSVKGLIVKDDKLLLVQEKSGMWELPGGGLDWQEDFHDCLKREIKEEMGLDVVKIGPKPIYIWTEDWNNMHRFFLGFKTEVNSLDFEKTDECVDAKFFSQSELQNVNVHPNLYKLVKFFNPVDFV